MLGLVFDFDKRSLIINLIEYEALGRKQAQIAIQ